MGRQGRDQDDQARHGSSTWLFLKKNQARIGEEELCQLHTLGTLTVASCRNLGFDKVDFGSGIGRQRG